MKPEEPKVISVDLRVPLPLAFPEQVKRLLDVESTLTPDQNQHMEYFLLQHQKNFSDKPGRTGILQHHINTGDSAPLSRKAYRTTPERLRIIEEQVKEMLEEGLIEECESPWASPVVLIKKPDGTMRFCIDYHQLNTMTLDDHYPMPNLDLIIHRLDGATFLSSMDLASGYYQIPVAEKDHGKTTFVCHEGLFQFKVMPFGLKTAPSTFNRLMARVLKPLSSRFTLSYLDDVIVFSKTFEDHLMHLDKVLELLLLNGLYVKLKKCQFCRREFKFLGKIINEGKIRMDPDKIRAVNQFVRPKTVKDIQRFLGMVGWLRSHIPNFAQLAEPLTHLTKKKVPFVWSDKCEESFDQFKTILVTPGIVLALPDFSRPFFVECDASDIGIGAILVQKNGRGEREIVEYASKLLKGPQLRYSTTEKELYAIIFALEKFRGYIGDNLVTVITDHMPLKWLLNVKPESGRLVHWVLRLQEFDYKIEYVKGTANVIADALSRGTELEDGALGEENLDWNRLVPTFSVATVQLELNLSSLFSLEELIKAQVGESWIKSIREKIRRGDRTLKNYVLLNNVLCYQKNATTELPRPIIPSSMVVKVIQVFHDHPESGNFGRAKTVARIGARVFWHKLDMDVRHFIRECPVCQEVKPPNKKLRLLMMSTIVSRPMELVGVDLMGPYPRSKRQNQFLLVFLDYFSKWVEIFPLRNSKIKTIAKHLLEMWCRFGVPQRMLSDNGPQFISKIYRTMCRVWGAEVSHTTRYHAQSNATERANQVIKKLIQTFIDRDHTNWDRYIPQFAMAIRSATHTSTGYSPAKLFLGREIPLPFDNSLRLSSFLQKSSPMDEQVKELEQEMVEIHKLVEKHVKSNQERQRRNYDKKANERSFEVGDVVKIRTFNLSNAAKRINAGFCKPWQGPCYITKKVNKLVYEVEDDKHKPLGKYNVVNIDKFYMSNQPTTPIRKDSGLGQVPHKHRYHTRSKNLTPSNKTCNNLE